MRHGTRALPLRAFCLTRRARGVQLFKNLAAVGVQRLVRAFFVLLQPLPVMNWTNRHSRLRGASKATFRDPLFMLWFMTRRSVFGATLSLTWHGATLAAPLYQTWETPM